MRSLRQSFVRVSGVSYVAGTTCLLFRLAWPQQSRTVRTLLNSCIWPWLLTLVKSPCASVAQSFSFFDFSLETCFDGSDEGPGSVLQGGVLQAGSPDVKLFWISKLLMTIGRKSGSSCWGIHSSGICTKKMGFVQTTSCLPGSSFDCTVRRRINTWIESPPNFARLVVGCIAADFCKQVFVRNSWRDLQDLHVFASLRLQKFSKQSSKCFLFFWFEKS